ncbi:MAG TPA: c-type cytochrome, partial [Rhizomicrobium sp.]|nr:c-type cytochrome [Rhizomicrobium sp.]
MMFSKKSLAIAAVALGSTAGLALFASASFGQGAAGPFNAAQLQAGHDAYVANCMVCHGDTMSGLGEAPAIAGRGFMVTFGNKTAKDLFDTIKAEMPFGTPGSLSDQTYT